MMRCLFFLLLLVPSSVAAQIDSSYVVIIRNSGMVKSAVPVKLKGPDLGQTNLRNKELYAYSPGSSVQDLSISLGKKQRNYRFKVPDQDTLYLEVRINAGLGGALPSSRFHPALKRITKRQAQALMTKRWAATE